MLVSAAGFFLEMQEIAFVGRENVKNIQKTIFYCLGGGGGGGGGGNPP